MKFIWLFYFIEIVILALIKPFVSNFEAVGAIAVLVHAIFSLLVLYTYKKNIRDIFIIGYSLRLTGLFWDIFARKIFVLPHSGADTEGFYRAALLISENISNIGSTKELYVQINSFLFHLIGPQRIFAQYLNVLLGISTIYLFYKTMNILKIDTKIKNKMLIVVALFPTSVILSSVFLREMAPTFFVMLSLYYFMKWYQHPRYTYMFLSFVYIGIASTFHSGVIGIAIGYLFSYLFYNHKTTGLKFTVKSIAIFLVMLIFLIPSISFFSNQIFGKFGNLEKAEDIYSATARAQTGGAVYLNNMSINNLTDFIFYSPIRSIYFLTSPLPWNWRGFNDIATFFLDSLFYLYTGIVAVKLYKNKKNHKVIITLLLLMIITTSVIFGTGVSNAGTALRHRQKISPLFFVLLSVLLNDRKLLGETECTVQKEGI